MGTRPPSSKWHKAANYVGTRPPSSKAIWAYSIAHAEEKVRCHKSRSKTVEKFKMNIKFRRKATRDDISGARPLDFRRKAGTFYSIPERERFGTRPPIRPHLHRFASQPSADQKARAPTYTEMLKMKFTHERRPK